MSSAKKIQVGLVAWKEKALHSPYPLNPEETVTAIVEAIEGMPLRGEGGDTREWVAIPIPLVAPLGIPVDTPSGVQEVWDTFIKPRQESGEIQSVEERVLMAILRAVYEGLLRREEKGK